MKKIILSILAATALCGAASAQKLSVAEVEALPGETVAYVLTIDVEDGNYKGFQYQMAFPTEGFTTVGTTVASSDWDGASFSVGELDVQGEANASAYSSSDTSIPNGERVIGTVKFTVADDLALGDYPVTITNFNFLDGTNYTPVTDVTFIIHVVNIHSVVLDENSMTAPDAAEGVNVTVKRTISANTWSTICLPFAMTEEQVKTAFGDDVELGDFTGYDTTEEGDDIIGITVNFDSATEIEANHPYIIKVSAPVTEFTVDGVDIAPEDVPCVSFGFTTGKGSKAVYHPIDFNGTYVADFDFFNDAQSQAIFLSENKFYYATENTKFMKAFRAYFDFDDVLSDVESSSARMAMLFDKSITGINKVSKKKSGTSGAVYDLQGRRVNKPIKGIFIKDGKKIVIEN